MLAAASRCCCLDEKSPRISTLIARQDLLAFLREDRGGGTTILYATHIFDTLDRGRPISVPGGRQGRARWRDRGSFRSWLNAAGQRRGALAPARYAQAVVRWSVPTSNRSSSCDADPRSVAARSRWSAAEPIASELRRDVRRRDAATCRRHRRAAGREPTFIPSGVEPGPVAGQERDRVVCDPPAHPTRCHRETSRTSVRAHALDREIGSRSSSRTTSWWGPSSTARLLTARACESLNRAGRFLGLWTSRRALPINAAHVVTVTEPRGGGLMAKLDVLPCASTSSPALRRAPDLGQAVALRFPTGDRHATRSRRTTARRANPRAARRRSSNQIDKTEREVRHRRQRRAVVESASRRDGRLAGRDDPVEAPAPIAAVRRRR